MFIKQQRVRALCTAAVFGLSALAGAAHAESQGQGAPTPALPTAKQTRFALYVTASELPKLIEKLGGAKRVLFVDVRTRAEAMFVGMPVEVDALIPFMELPAMMDEWDDQKNAYKLEPNSDFLPALDARLAAKQLARSAPVILLCRAGDRSAKAANLLKMAGYGQVYTVTDGYEGDVGKDGRRSVNGWKNAGLNWTYRLQEAKAYFPDERYGIGQ